MVTTCSCATACDRDRPLSSWLTAGHVDGVGSGIPMRPLPREGEEQVDAGNGPDALDSVLSRLAKVTQSADTAQRVAATVTVGVLAAAVVGVITVIPSTGSPRLASPKAAVPANPGFQVTFPAANITMPVGVEQAPGQQVLGG